MARTPTIDTIEQRTAREHRGIRGGIKRETASGLNYRPAGLVATQTLTNGVLGLAPLPVERRCLLTHMGAMVAVVGTVGAVIRLGVYADDGSGVWPGALILDAGTIDGTSNTAQTIDVTDLWLPRGLYWVGGVLQGAPSTPSQVRGVSTTGSVIMPNKNSDGFDMTIQNTCAVQASVTGALPSTFTTTVGYSSVCPMVGLRLR